jgi:Zn-dependent M28 family amino/carboxypeptidase
MTYAHTIRWLLLAAIAAPIPLAAQAPSSATRVAQAVRPEVLRAHLEFLSDDALEGRAPGTRGGEIAAKYIAAQFERLGLAPAGDNGTYYHLVPIITHTPDPTLRVTGPDSATLPYRDDYVMWSMRDEPAVSVEAPAVFVGYGIVAPEYRWNDYQNVDVHGKIVICLMNDPGLRDSTIFRGKILTYYGRWTYKIEEAARQGAAGILMVHTPETATYGWSTVTGSWTGQQVRLEAPATSLVVAGWLQESTARALFKQGGADLDQVTALAATREFKPVPLNLNLAAAVSSTIRRSTTSNVVARLPGQGSHATEAVMIGGHYDHLGIRVPAVNGDSIYNGAMDNASGTAAVLTAAEAFVTSGVRPARSIYFMAFSAEESGLLGSAAFAANPTLPLRSLAAVLNMDVMNLFGRTRDIAALGVDQSSLGQVFTRAAGEEQLKVTVNQDALIRGSFFRSDHFPFAKAGVPALSLESGEDFVGKPAGWGQAQQEDYTDHRYHQPGDEILPWYTMDGAVQQLRTIVRTAVAVASAPSQPTWSRGSEFYAAGQERLKH